MPTIVMERTFGELEVSIGVKKPEENKILFRLPRRLWNIRVNIGLESTGMDSGINCVDYVGVTTRDCTSLFVRRTRDLSYYPVWRLKGISLEGN